jgi:EmrB/QacA subfamily drug resistance transporter
MVGSGIASTVTGEPELMKNSDLEPMARAQGEAPNGGPHDKLPLDHSAIRGIVIGIMLAMFLSALEQTIVAPALPTIGRNLGDVENLAWVVTAYLLAATAVTPLFGKLSDIYGRRTILLVSVGIFIAGSIACAFAPTMLTLILARALQGIGGGGILPLAQTVIADMVAPRERGRYQGYTAVMFMAASVVGPLLGGVLTEQLHWSLIFWINVPLGLVALAMTDRALRRLPRHDRPHQIDMLGAALMVAASIALLLALTWGGVAYPWLSPQILGLVGASCVLWVLFAVRLMSAAEPFIPLTMMQEPVVGAIVAAGFFSIGTVIGLSIFIPLYLELVLGLPASASGGVLIAFMAGTVVGSLTVGRVIAHMRRYKRIGIAGLMLAIGVLVVLATNPAGFSVAAVTALTGVLGAGLGTMYPMTTIIIQNVVPPHQLGTATGTLNFFRLLGGAIIVAVFGAIVLGGADPAHMRLDHAVGAGRLTTDLALAFRWVFIAAAAFLAAGLVAMLIVEERELRGRPAA